MLAIRCIFNRKSRPYIRTLVFKLQAEQFPSMENYCRSLKNESLDTSFLFCSDYDYGVLNNSNLGQTWNYIDRGNYNDANDYQPPEIAVYTAMSLKGYTALIVLISLIQVLVIYVTKSCLSKSYRKAPFLDQIFHALENTHLSFPIKDWDEKKSGDPNSHKKRMKKVKKETLAVLILNFLFAICISFSPLYVLCKYTM